MKNMINKIWFKIVNCVNTIVRLKFKKEQTDYTEYNKKISIYNEYLVDNGLKPYPLMSDVDPNRDFYCRYLQYQTEQLTLLYETRHEIT